MERKLLAKRKVKPRNGESLLRTYNGNGIPFTLYTPTTASDEFG